MFAFFVMLGMAVICTAATSVASLLGREVYELMYFMCWGTWLYGSAWAIVMQIRGGLQSAAKELFRHAVVAEAPAPSQVPPVTGDRGGITVIKDALRAAGFKVTSSDGDSKTSEIFFSAADGTEFLLKLSEHEE